MATIIDGRAVSQATRAQIKEDVERFIQQSGVTPALAVIVVGDDPASAVYVRNKHKGCLECGMTNDHAFAAIKAPAQSGHSIAVKEIAGRVRHDHYI